MTEDFGKYYKDDSFAIKQYACDVLQTNLLTTYVHFLNAGGVDTNIKLEKLYQSLGFQAIDMDNHQWIKAPTEDDPEGEYLYHYRLFHNQAENLIILNNVYDVASSVRIYSKGANRNFFDEIKIELQKLEPVVDKNRAYVNFLFKSSNGMGFKESEVKLPEINRELHYNNLPHEEIVEKVNSEGSGIIYFSGAPGTGKTTYIKYLSTLSTRKFFYLTTDVFSELSDPTYTEFVLEHLKDSVLFIEDAEILLASRETYHNSEVSNILNWSDGMLGDVLNCKIILTQNYESNTDEAVFRKGRLLVRHNFDLLKPEQANDIAGFDKFTEPTSLADALFTKENEEVETKKETKIGF